MTHPSSLSRRRFLALSSVGLGVLATPSAWARTLAGRSITVTEAEWDALRAIVGKQQLVRPENAAYDTAALPYNQQFRDIRPEGVVYCTSASMVSRVLLWCRNVKMPFVVRGGGHSYAGYSCSPGLVIDMRDMARISYDENNQTLTIGAGALNGALYEALRTVDRTMTHGRCAGVGVAGFLLGGGIGFDMRHLGLACDSLLAAQIVTADGEIRNLSRTSVRKDDQDLFFALRGGAGGHFGISTAFTVQTAPVPKLTVFRIVCNRNTLAVAKRVFAAVDQAPNSLGTRISLKTDGLPSQDGSDPVELTVLGQFAGAKSELENLLNPVFKDVDLKSQDVLEMPYWDGQTFLKEEPDCVYFQERSAFLRDAPSDTLLEGAYARLLSWPGTGGHSEFFFFQTGGKVNETAWDKTAFVHRDSRWLSVIGITWDSSDNKRPEIVRLARDWQDAFYRHINANGGYGAYQNFPDPALSADEWRLKYYDRNLGRLQQAKYQFDRYNVFSHPQSIL